MHKAVLTNTAVVIITQLKFWSATAGVGARGVFTDVLAAAVAIITFIDVWHGETNLLYVMQSS